MFRTAVLREQLIPVSPASLSLAFQALLDPKRNGAEPFRARSPSHVVANLFLDLRLPRLCHRPIAFTETLAASAIPPLDETRSQVVAPAIAANEFLWFRLAPHLLPERPCRLSLFRGSLLPDRLLTGRPRRVLLILLGR